MILRRKTHLNIGEVNDGWKDLLFSNRVRKTSQGTSKVFRSPNSQASHSAPSPLFPHHSPWMKNNHTKETQLRSKHTTGRRLAITISLSSRVDERGVLSSLTTPTFVRPLLPAMRVWRSMLLELVTGFVLAKVLHRFPFLVFQKF